MSTTEATFIKELKRQVIITLIGGLLTVVLTAVGFYFNTKHSLDKIYDRYEYIDNRQNLLYKRIEYVNERKVDKEDVIREFNEIKQLIRDTNIKIDRL